MKQQKMNRLNFSGHESFQCRELWLKKGYDFVKEGNSFQDPSAVVKLGVGKNMVTSIRYWMTAFNLLDSEKKLTDFANYIFGPDGKDPFLEDNGTLWLLHYQLIRKKRASIYSLFFNDFRKTRVDFTKIQMLNYLNRKCDEYRNFVSENTIKTDIGVFLNTYLRPQKGQKEFKDLLTGLLTDLELVERIGKKEENGEPWYQIVNSDREELPIEVFLYCILCEDSYGDSISLHTLITEEDSVGSIFAVSSNGVVKKLKELTEKYIDLTYTDDAGIRELQIKSKINKWEILDDYYG